MKRVILTVGPRGAGKTTFCKKIIDENPNVAYISRDEFLTFRCGDEAWNPYSRAMHVGMLEFWDEVEKLLRQNQTLIVDVWNSTEYQRLDMSILFRSYGAETVEAWYFVTSSEQCAKWFVERERKNKLLLFTWSLNKMRAEAIEAHRTFHKEIGEISKDFDVVREIDPSQGEAFQHPILSDL